MDRNKLCSRLRKSVRQYWKTSEALRYHSTARAPFGLVDAVFFEWHTGKISIGSVCWILCLGIQREELINSCRHEFVQWGNGRDEFPCERERFEDLAHVLDDVLSDIARVLRKAGLDEYDRTVFYTADISRNTDHLAGMSGRKLYKTLLEVMNFLTEMTEDFSGDMTSYNKMAEIISDDEMERLYTHKVNNYYDLLP